MRQGILKWLRKHGRLPSFFLLLAIVAPVLFGAMPASAEQRLIQDLSFNICTQAEDGGSQEQMPSSHEHCCILCASAGNILGAATVAHVLIPPPLKIRCVDVVLAASETPPTPPDLRATAPRGPPTV
jgi:hypothetical protein